MNATESSTPQATTVPNNDANGTLSGTASLAIMIPLLVIGVGTIIGLIAYYALRARRTRIRAQQQANSASGASGPNGDSVVAIAPAMEEGFNELGEAPPPYGVVDTTKNHVQIYMSSLGTSSLSLAGPAEGPAELPPAYIAGMAISGTGDRNP